jgi:peptidoglycan-associated lipoprotein
MSSFRGIGRGMRLAAVVALALVVGACAQARDTDDMAAGGGAGMGNAAPGTSQDFAVNVGDRVYFETDSTVLTGRARETLNRQAQWLRLYPHYQAAIEGHADERGTREYNLGLSARRATVVRDYLVSQGIPGSRLRTVAYGKERPVAVCNDDSCWSQNRRAVTAVASGPTS